MRSGRSNAPLRDRRHRIAATRWGPLMLRRSRLSVPRERRRYRIVLTALALLLMGASSWPSGCHHSGSSSSSSSTGVLIVGGENSSGSILDSAELFDQSTGTFSYVDNAMSDGRAFQTATLLKNG